MCYLYQYSAFLNHRFAIMVFSFILKYIISRFQLHMPIVVQIVFLFCTVIIIAFCMKTITDRVSHFIKHRVCQIPPVAVCSVAVNQLSKVIVRTPCLLPNCPNMDRTETSLRPSAVASWCSPPSERLTSSANAVRRNNYYNHRKFSFHFYFCFLDEKSLQRYVFRANQTSVLPILLGNFNIFMPILLGNFDAFPPILLGNFVFGPQKLYTSPHQRRRRESPKNGRLLFFVLCSSIYLRPVNHICRNKRLLELRLDAAQALLGFHTVAEITGTQTKVRL